MQYMLPIQIMMFMRMRVPAPLHTLMLSTFLRFIPTPHIQLLQPRPHHLQAMQLMKHRDTSPPHLPPLFINFIQHAPVGCEQIIPRGIRGR